MHLQILHIYLRKFNLIIMEDIMFGLLKGIECKFVKTEIEVIQRLSEETGIDIERVKLMMRYNIFTMNQFSQLTQLTLATVAHKTTPTIMNREYNTELDFCYPFADNEKSGPKFIVRNEKSEKYLNV